MVTLFTPERVAVGVDGFLNVFCVDPGVRTGWAWAYVPVSWLRADGAVDVLHRLGELDLPMFLTGELGSGGVNGEDGLTSRLVEFQGKGTVRGASWWCHRTSRPDVDRTSLGLS